MTDQYVQTPSRHAMYTTLLASQVEYGTTPGKYALQANGTSLYYVQASASMHVW